MPRLFYLLACTALLTLSTSSTTCYAKEAAVTITELKVQSIPNGLRQTFQLPAFYKKCVVLKGFPIVSSEKVRDEALLESAWIIQSMLQERDDILHALAKNKVRLAVMAYNERTTDVPEHADLKPGVWWDARARGLGPTPQRPACSCGEENILNFPGDPYNAENILIHEFAHAIHDMGMSLVDPSFDGRLKAAYQSAIKNGLWKNTYAATNHQEYWAESVQSWFWNNRSNDSIHNHVDTREELQAYDPKAAALCREVFGKHSWRYLRTDAPERIGKGHLATLDRSKLPTFQWSKAEKAALTKKQ